MRGNLLRLAKALGLFWLARRLTPQGLHILCYHGFSTEDEHEFRPKLYMRVATLEARLRWLRGQGYSFVPLGEAIARLKKGTLAPRTLAVTIDDGWRSTYDLALPVFQKLDCPVTIYVTTYYVVNPHPVFRLAVQYVFWRTRRNHVDLTGLVPGGSTGVPTKGEEGERLAQQVFEFGERWLTEQQRLALLRELGMRLDVDVASLESSGRLSLMTADQLRQAAANGVDIQLHTHRHILPTESEGMKREIDDNRSILEPLVGRRLLHLCYPSGLWDPAHILGLKMLGIESATICDPGPNRPDSEPLALRRLLDEEHMDPLEIEAELVGLKELLRSAARWAQTVCNPRSTHR